MDPGPRTGQEGQARRGKAPRGDRVPNATSSVIGFFQLTYSLLEQAPGATSSCYILANVTVAIAVNGRCRCYSSPSLPPSLALALALSMLSVNANLSPLLSLAPPRRLTAALRSSGR
ncbi:hypothetical protein E4U47_005260 [Claviceps purpurea]|nr:hypothetical protein E4U47_005260 [Claviceps purpurea]KAG6319320.1 hypothetical protein E4U44_007089 [Claviceps purpurea]